MIEKLKSNKKLRFIIISVIYILATFSAIGIYNIVLLPWWLSLLIADVFATIVVFGFSVLFKNASVYDPYWSVAPIVILILYAIGKDFSVPRLLIILAVLFWGIRLTLNWAYNFGSFEYQDWRYTMLSEKTGKLYPLVNFVGIHLVPTLVVYLCCIPVVYAFKNDLKTNVWSIIFIIVSFLAVILQGTADIQMHKYRKKKATPFIRTGLWKYSRHPNYLGEILMWWGIGLCVFSMTLKWYLLIGAIANTLLFLFVSIPMADKRQSRKEGFSEYKKETWMLLPIPKFIKK